VLDLVPLAGTGRVVADVDRYSTFVGDPLQLALPHVGARAVAAAGVGGDVEFFRLGVALDPDPLPPRFDRSGREHRRVVVHAHAHEAFVGVDVKDTVWDRLADGIRGEVVDVNQIGLVLRLPLASPVFEVADQLLLLRVDRDDRNAPVDAVLRLRIDVLELRVAIRMLGALYGLVRRLEAVAVIAQQLGHRPVTDPNAVLMEQLAGQHLRALACPPQRRLRVTPSDRIDELLQRGPHLRMHDLIGALAAAATDIDDILGPRTRPSLVPPLAHRADCQARRARYRCHSTVPHDVGLRTGPQPSRSLIHRRPQQAPLSTNLLFRVHDNGRSRLRVPVDPHFAFFTHNSIDLAILDPL